jgi:hypothetical protein
MVLKKCERVKEPTKELPVLCQFFHENPSVFKLLKYPELVVVLRF